ncbi:MAG TPA: hypothetical protein H9875_08530 [Candidatus Levilactobacillus faecigallinarum]|uniref:Uncharacterized protein n=1 Tax=Candidatus Levilactobacillus faecigallinarum TaxID=2838638 RepID=A0A9D1QTQ5_9LACO|nr:hypothetical protein [Candidatus Levilactobacillus faecigallinarum]
MSKGMNRLLPELHRVESQYGSIDNAPQDVVKHIQNVEREIDTQEKVPLDRRKRGRIMDRIIVGLPLSKMTIGQIAKVLNADDEFTLNGEYMISNDALHSALKRREVLVKKSKNVRGHIVD